MKNLPKPKRMLLLGGLSFMVALIATLGVRSYLQNRADMEEGRRRAVDSETIGIMSQAEHIRWRDVNRGVYANKELSDEDFDWCLMMLKQTKDQPVQNSVKNANIITGVLLKSVENEGVTPERKERLYKAVAPLLRDKTHLNRLLAVNTMVALNERRAIPDMLPLLNDPNLGLRPIVRKALDKMGYPVSGNAP